MDVTETFKDILRERETAMEEVEVELDPSCYEDNDENSTDFERSKLEYYNEDLIKTLIKISNEIDKLRVQIEKLGQRRKGSPANDSLLVSLSASLKKSYENLSAFNDLLESHKNAQSVPCQMRSRNFFDFLNAVVQILLIKFNNASALFAAEKHYLTSSYVPRPELIASSSPSSKHTEHPLQSDGSESCSGSSKKANTDEEKVNSEDSDGKDEMKRKRSSKKITPIVAAEDDDDSNTADERREFAMENRAFVVRMGNENREALRGIERQMCEISEMQRIIALKVMEQADDIDLIHRQAERTEREIKEGNDILRNITSAKPKKKWYEFCDCNACMVNTFLILGTLLLFFNWIHF